MTLVASLTLAVCLIVNLSGIEGHGRLSDPVHRGGAFRKQFPNPANYDDDGNYCGGFVAHYKVNGGKCGVCGDSYSLPRPRPNENGGTYGNGIIVKSYEVGSKIKVEVELTANHMGYFTFSLCRLKNSKQLETEKCFDRHKLKLAKGGFKYPVKAGKFLYSIKLRLPKGLTCKHCVLRWQYTAGNNWGTCEDDEGRLGCGDQETFRTCSDITIL